MNKFIKISSIIGLSSAALEFMILLIASFILTAQASAFYLPVNNLFSALVHIVFWVLTLVLCTNQKIGISAEITLLSCRIFAIPFIGYILSHVQSLMLGTALSNGYSHITYSTLSSLILILSYIFNATGTLLFVIWGMSISYKKFGKSKT